MKTYTFGHWRTSKWPPDNSSGFTYTIRVWLDGTMFIYHGLKTLSFGFMYDETKWKEYTSSSEIVNWLYDDPSYNARFTFTINEWYPTRAKLRAAEQLLIKNETQLSLNGIGPDAVWLLMNNGDWSCLDKL